MAFRNLLGPKGRSHAPSATAPVFHLSLDRCGHVGLWPYHITAGISTLSRRSWCQTWSRPAMVRHALRCGQNMSQSDAPSWSSCCILLNERWWSFPQPLHWWPLQRQPPPSAQARLENTAAWHPEWLAWVTQATQNDSEGLSQAKALLPLPRFWQSLLQVLDSQLIHVKHTASDSVTVISNNASLDIRMGYRGRSSKEKPNSRTIIMYYHVLSWGTILPKLLPSSTSYHMYIVDRNTSLWGSVKWSRNNQHRSITKRNMVAISKVMAEDQESEQMRPGATLLDLVGWSSLDFSTWRMCVICPAMQLQPASTRVGYRDALIQASHATARCKHSFHHPGCKHQIGGFRGHLLCTELEAAWNIRTSFLQSLAPKSNKGLECHHAQAALAQMGLLWMIYQIENDGIRASFSPHFVNHHS